MSLQQLWTASHKCKAATGKRSPLEALMAGALERAGVSFLYEAARITFNKPAFYRPDFALPEQAIVIETKGYFMQADRDKMLRIKAAHPDLDIRFLFTEPNNRIGKGSKTTYARWCHRHGFPFAKGGQIPPDWLEQRPTGKELEPFLPPQEWLAHRPSPAQQAAFQAVFQAVLNVS
jgi:hypothetical protein